MVSDSDISSEANDSDHFSAGIVVFNGSLFSGATYMLSSPILLSIRWKAEFEQDFRANSLDREAMIHYSSSVRVDLA